MKWEKIEPGLHKSGPWEIERRIVGRKWCIFYGEEEDERSEWMTLKEAKQEVEYLEKEPQGAEKTDDDPTILKWNDPLP